MRNGEFLVANIKVGGSNQEKITLKLAIYPVDLHRV